MTSTKLLTGVAALALLGTVGTAAAAPVTGLLNNNSIVRFDSATPGTTTAAVAVQGLAAGEGVRGIDYRPLDGRLYGVVSQADGSGARVVRINQFTGATLAVAPLASNAANDILLPGVTPVTIGRVNGIDFNPVPDLLRLVGDGEQNLRINAGGRVAGGPAGSTAIDGALNFGGVADSTLNVISAAYTNPDNDPATGTTLYTLDSVSDELFIQAPPNAGTQSMGQSLGVNAVGAVGFDIAGADFALASFATSRSSLTELFAIALATGQATSVGFIGGQDLLGSLKIADIAIAPIPAALPLLAAAMGGLGFMARRRRA